MNKYIDTYFSWLIVFVTVCLGVFVFWYIKTEYVMPVQFAPAAVVAPRTEAMQDEIVAASIGETDTTAEIEAEIATLDFDDLDREFESIDTDLDAL